MQNAWNSTLSRPKKPMRRSAFKPPSLPLKKEEGDRKPRSAPRRGLKRSRTDTVGKLKKRVWELCKAITRAKYRKPNGTFNCFTCGRLIDCDAKAQTGHFISNASGGASLRFHLPNLRIQDYYCNINLGGNGAEFYRNLVQEIGQEQVDRLFVLKNQTVKADKLFYKNLIVKYEKLLKQV